MAAHDLRSPIANISQICELMFPELENKMNKEDFEFLKNIEVSSKYVYNLLNDLLDVAQIESGKMTLKKSSIQVYPFIQNIWKQNSLPAGRKNISLVLEYRADESFSIPIDAIKIEQVINNLLSNAIKFSFSKSKIVFGVAIQDNRLRISVKDEGPGIPLNEQHKLFKAFQKTSVQATAGEKSTGLGLMISSNIVTAHGGKMALESEPGKGSVFFFELPMK